MMSVEDAIGAGLLVVLSAALTFLALAAFSRRKTRPFLLLATGFGFFLAEAVIISLAVLGLAFEPDPPLVLMAGLQVIGLLLMYLASFPPR